MNGWRERINVGGDARGFLCFKQSIPPALGRPCCIPARNAYLIATEGCFDLSFSLLLVRVTGTPHQSSNY